MSGNPSDVITEKVSLYVCMLSCSVVVDSVTPWTVARQAPLSMEFSRQEYWSRLPFPPPGDLPDPGIEPMSPVSPALVGGFFTTEPPGSRYSIAIYNYVFSFISEIRYIHIKYIY